MGGGGEKAWAKLIWNVKTMLRCCVEKLIVCVFVCFFSMNQFCGWEKGRNVLKSVSPPPPPSRCSHNYFTMCRSRNIHLWHRNFKSVSITCAAFSRFVCCGGWGSGWGKLLSCTLCCGKTFKTAFDVTITIIIQWGNCLCWNRNVKRD